MSVFITIIYFQFLLFFSISKSTGPHCKVFLRSIWYQLQLLRNLRTTCVVIRLPPQVPLFSKYPFFFSVSSDPGSPSRSLPMYTSSVTNCQTWQLLCNVYFILCAEHNCQEQLIHLSLALGNMAFFKKMNILFE